MLFAIKRGTLAAKAKDAANLPKGVSFALYLYILAIIILDEPAEHITNDAPNQPPEAFGVLNIEELVYGEDEDDEYGGGEGQVL